MSDTIPLWLKIVYGAGVPIVIAVYWRAYGAANFLWLSDIALFCTAATALSGISLFASMAAVGVIPLEVAWAVDFASGGRLMGLAAYMFDEKYPLYLRGISLFHLAIPPTLIYLLLRLGYDSRALLAQSVLTCIVFSVTYFATDPEKNINWVFGPGANPQHAIPPFLYLGLEITVLLLFVFLPMHLGLKYLFRPA